MNKKIKRPWSSLSWLLPLVLASSLVSIILPDNQVEADPGMLEWSEVNNPNSAGAYATFVVAPSDIIDVEICNDGTMFAAIQAEADIPFFDPYLLATEYGVLKSTTGGSSWTRTGFAPSATPIVDIAASPEYDEDTTLWVAQDTAVQRTINGGTSFGPVTPTGLVGTITSIDVAPDYLGSGLNAVVGTSSAGAASVLLFTERAAGWGAVSTASFGTWDNAWVAFSPDYESDGGIIAVVSDDIAGTCVRFSFQERAWDSEVVMSTPLHNDTAPDGVNVEATDASIAFPDDYDSLSAINIFVGVTGAAGDGDAFRIIGMVPPESASIAVDLNSHPNKVCDISSIAVSGTMEDSTVIVGATGSTDVRRSTNPTDTVPSWRGSYKRATGDGTTVVRLANDFATSDVVYAATLGASSALSRASDASTFNGIALVDTAIDALADVAAASKDVLFLVTEDLAADESLWRSTNGGQHWERVHTAAGISQVIVSPDYAEEDTVYTAHIGDTRMWKSANSGDTWTGISARENVTAWTVVDDTTIITGDATGRIWISFNSGLRWTPSSTAPVGLPKTIAVSPNYEADCTVLVGTANGHVYMSTDIVDNFSRVGATGPGGADDDIYVAFDSDYATNSIIYAGSENQTTEGIFRWQMDVSTVWELIDDAGDVDLMLRALILSADGVLYASNASPGTGMERSELPTAPLEVVQDYFQTVDDALAPTATLGDLEAVAGFFTVLFAIDGTNVSLQGYIDPGITPAIGINPTSGPRGTEITVVGTGFASNETGIAVTWDGIAVITGVTADEIGDWGPQTFSVPVDAAPGEHTVDAHGDVTTAGDVDDVIFTVPTPRIAINPKSGSGGTMITVVGTGFASNETSIAVTWDGTDVITGVTALADGSWGPETFIVPVDAAPGDHTFDAYGAIISALDVLNVTFIVTTGLEVEVESTEVSVGSSSSVDIWVKNYPAVPDETKFGLGFYTIRVDFDPTMILVNGVSPGDAPFDDPGYVIHTDSVTVTQYSKAWPGTGGDIRLCALQFNCLAEGATSLYLTVDKMSDVNSTALTPAAVDGAVYQLPAPPLPPVVVEVQSATVVVGSSSSVDIWVKGYHAVPDETEYGLGAYSVRVDCDPMMIDITGVSPGNPPFDDPIYNIYADYVNIAQFHGEWPGPDGDIKLCSLQFNCLAEGIAALELTVQTLANVNGYDVSYFPHDGVITQILYEVEAAIAEVQELDGVVVIPVTIVRVKDPSTEETVTGVEVSGYAVGLGFPIGFMEILDIRGGDPPFDSTPNWQTTGNWIDVDKDISPTAVESPITIFRIVASLTDSCDVSDMLRVYALANRTGGGPMPAQDQPMVLTFQRGDIKKEGPGTVNITDAMFGAQYIVGMRGVEDISQLNMASVKQDGASGDKANITDCMFIAQYVVGLRDEYFGLVP